MSETTYAPPSKGDTITYTKHGGRFVGVVTGITSLNNTKAPGWILSRIEHQILSEQDIDTSRGGEIELVRPWEVDGGPSEEEFNRLRQPQ
jgi:hypothetical protein